MADPRPPWLDTLTLSPRGFAKLQQTLEDAKDTGFTPEAWVAGGRWTFAKTYADTAPHEYVVRGDTAHPNEAWFFAMVHHIAEHGYVGSFGRWSYHYLEMDGWKYWSMPGYQTINREPIGGYE